MFMRHVSLFVLLPIFNFPPFFVFFLLLSACANQMERPPGVASAADEQRPQLQNLPRAPHLRHAPGGPVCVIYSYVLCMCCVRASMPVCFRLFLHACARVRMRVRVRAYVRVRVCVLACVNIPTNMLLIYVSSLQLHRAVPARSDVD